VLKGIEAIELQLKGYSGAEIARMYSVKNNNVTSWISKARAALRKEYPGDCTGYFFPRLYSIRKIRCCICKNLVLCYSQNPDSYNVKEKRI
jgi:hypothetical protein